MNKITVKGGNRLYGTVQISGMKNAALPIVFASIVTGETCIIENIPLVDDVLKSIEIIREMGGSAEFIEPTTVKIDTKNFVAGSSPDDLACKIRGSMYLLGAELARSGETVLKQPGGCNIGKRPMDIHMKAFTALGADMDEGDDYIRGKVRDKLRGANIYFDFPSVGATINAIIAAVTAEGTTVIENAAREPHIVDVANFFNTCGANVTGAGTNTIKIHGVEKLHGCTYAIIPDMIEAGTYMTAVAATGGSVTIEGIIPKHMESVSQKLIDMGACVEEGDEWITVTSDGHLRGIKIKTMPYPGFPTDMQQQFGALLCLAEGEGEIYESIFEDRLRYTAELGKMGAQITVSDRTATFHGVKKLTGASVRALDLRAGAALVIAGLCAEGKTEVSGADYIYRGYYDFVPTLRRLGADISEDKYATHIYGD
ncbi:MAG: UDP-N-acetylglucosamine 1-carboxyvinyltransferase [Ruminococcaceae bacterium]|nr:UDP-N-acetylglucosamine 1-carboxyvinyltransferase [Oscillospiraceae bacterium]